MMAKELMGVYVLVRRGEENGGLVGGYERNE